MDTVRVFFTKIRALFFYFQNRAGEASPLVARLGSYIDYWVYTTNFFTYERLSIPLKNVGNKVAPWLETSYDYTALYSLSAADKYMCKVNYKNTRTRCERCSKFSRKKLGWRHLLLSVVFIFNFEHIAHLILVSLLLVLNR